jgi:hypothetical protein
MRTTTEGVKNLIKLIKTNFLNDDSLLSASFPPVKRTMFDHFDDIVPFFIFFGETNFLIEQVKIIKQKNFSLFDICSRQDMLLARNVDEYIGGLYSLWKETKDSLVKQVLDEGLKYLENKLFRNDFFYGTYYPKCNKTGKYYESWSAGLLETFCEMREDYPEKFAQAKKILSSWVHSEYFKTYQLFPYRYFESPFLCAMQKMASIFKRVKLADCPPTLTGGFEDYLKNIKTIFKNSFCSQMMKSNSTPAFALLEFYRATGDEIWLNNLKAWINSTLKTFYQNGNVFHLFLPNIKQGSIPGLAPALILCDLICDYSYFTGDKQFLPFAKNIIDRQLEKKLKNGLIPEFENGTYDHLDNQIDFAIAMRRYAELTGEDAYQKNSVELTEKVMTEHYTQNGYLTYSGDGKSASISPKYNSLVLKGFINLQTIEEKIYPKYHSLFKDR